MLQNVHRGGQGQTLGLVNPYELSPSSSSSSSSSSSPPSFATALLTQQQYQRPTTYRPISRREDQVQVVRAIDYRIPKSLHSQEPLAQQLHRLEPASYHTQTVQYADDDGSNLDDSSTYQEQLGTATERSRSRVQVTGEPQSNSYSRLLRYQGDRRLDSFVRY